MIYKYVAVPFVTKGNLFPNSIILDTVQKVLYFQSRENNLICKILSSVPLKSIAAVRLYHRNEWFFFSGIEVETYGGKIISASGFKSKEAKELKDLLDQYR